MVLLGRLGDPAAVDALLPWIGEIEASLSHRWVASDALAHLGEAALPRLVERLEGGADDDERLWIYAALASMKGSDRAHERLLEALESDLALAHVIGSAITSQGQREDLPRLAAALERVEPWQRIELEAAIQDIHFALEDESIPEDWDWRLRFRVHPRWRTVEPSWPMVAAVATEEGLAQRRDPPPLRTLEEVLAAPRVDDDPGPLCDDCGEPLQRPTGLWICPDTAAAIPVVQLDLLARVRDEEGLDDLFDVLDLVETDELMLRAEKPRGRRAREEWGEEIERLELLRGTCRWAIEQGMEDVGSVRARLLAETVRLRTLYGDPQGYLAESPPPARREIEPGRNDPCPCGSGRKYKKCCGGARRAVSSDDPEPGIADPRD
jgi:hypothetical protein